MKADGSALTLALEARSTLSRQFWIIWLEFIAFASESVD